MGKRRIKSDEATRIIIERSEKLIANGKNPKEIINMNRKAMKTIEKDLAKYDAFLDKEGFLWFEKGKK
jgi:hypothetical protein